MDQQPPHEVTRLLLAWSEGDPQAHEQLMTLVYDELHRLAQRYMNRESPGHPLQTTALVNEAWLKLIDQRKVRWQNRAHFFGIAAQLMRRILVDQARAHLYQKRGGGLPHVSFERALLVSQEPDEDLVALDDALQELSELDTRKSRVVELRFFGGLSVAETAEVLKVSQDTVMRDWTTAKAWLYRQLSKREAE